MTPTAGAASRRHPAPPATVCAAACAVNGCGLTLKNTLPTARTMIRPCVVETGKETSSVPSFGVAAARTVENVAPLSVESRMSTVGVLTAPASVPATFQVTVAVPA